MINLDDKKRKSGYRKKYEKFLGVSIPSDFDVHHIDLNPLNNELGNLVAIPRPFHRAYHDFKSMYPFYIETHTDIAINGNVPNIFIRGGTKPKAIIDRSKRNLKRLRKIMNQYDSYILKYKTMQDIKHKINTLFHNIDIY